MKHEGSKNFWRPFLIGAVIGVIGAALFAAYVAVEDNISFTQALEQRNLPRVFYGFAVLGGLVALRLERNRLR